MLPKRPSASTVVDILRARASAMQDKLAFQYLSGQGAEQLSMTYGDLDRRARAIGGELQALAAEGERALLLFPPGLDFITAFFGCLYAGIVAVPAAPPGRHRMTSSVEAIFDAAQPSLVLSTVAHRQLARQSYGHLTKLFERPWVAVDSIADDRSRVWHDPRVDGDHLAFLQYTSGSTSSPKGVMLTHGNLLFNATLIQEAFNNTPDGWGVFWLPLYHDMGLIGGVVQPAFCGGPCTLLAPAAFLQRPALWLETISRLHATVSGGPDFAYDLCVRKISPAEREKLDLSSWQVAFTGAERVRAETIERFAKTFAPCGFRREAFFPCYGLAEATLMVSGGPRLTPPSIIRVRTDELGKNRVKVLADDADDVSCRTLVGSGECLPGQTIRIVDPESHRVCVDDTVGEIWVQGPSVATGYYQRPEASETAFAARLSDTNEGPFLRTGDLGFRRDGQLFVTGRLKDIIIIRGRNYYPEDIERSVDRSHKSFRAGFCAAFAVDVADRDRLVVVQEIEPRHRHVDMSAALQAVRGAISAQHELEVYAVVLVRAGTIPKTSSGKTRRSACRENYLTGQLEILGQWKADDSDGNEAAAEILPAACPESLTAADIESWLIERIAARLRLTPSQIHVTTPFLEFGMGSVDAVEIAAQLECWLGRRLSPTAIYNHPNIAALARWLVRPQVDSTPPPTVRPPQPHISLRDTDPNRLLYDVQQMTDDEMQAFLLQEMAKQ
ncbi:MAG: AMP-binding protein [Thermoguttaceae bacterium]